MLNFNFKKNQIMKRAFYLMSIVFIASLTSISCSKEDDKTENTTVVADVADDIAASMGSSNSGLSSEIIEIAELSGEYADEGLKSMASDTVYSVDTNFTRENPAGTVITFNYSYQMEYGYIFEGSTLNRLYYNCTIEGGYDAPRISSADNRTSNWSLTGLDISSSAYILNGTTVRTGNSESKIRNKSQTYSDSQISLSNVKIDKSTLEIVEGTLTWHITGTVNAKSYDYNVIVSYLGNGKAELTIDGVKYTIDIESGEIE